MRLALLTSTVLTVALTSAVAHADGFGAALGGSLVGSTLGTIIGNSVSRPAPPPVYYHPAPVYIQPQAQPRAAAPRPQAAPVAVYAPALPPDPDSPSYQQGASDREAFDSWYTRLDGQMKQGAAFWNDQHALPNPQQCRLHASYGNDWMDGCSSAVRRLGAPDDRRKRDAQYRNGWDKLMPEVRSAAAAPPVAVPVSASPPAAPEAKETGLGDVFTTDMLGVEVPYLEKTVGPAKRVTKLGGDKTLRTYTVAGCPVKAHVEGSTVYAFGMELSATCNVSLKPFFDDFASTKNLTLGKFVRMEGDGGFHATCLQGCGKNDDGLAEYHYQGPRPQRLEVSLYFPVQDGASDDTAGTVAKMMADKETPAYVSTAAFNCDDKYSAKALEAYKNAVVTEIVIGTGIEDEAGLYKAACQKTN